MPLLTATTAHVAPSTLRRWTQSGSLVAIDRGIYIPAEEASQEHLELAAAILRQPLGVIVLQSALHLHQIGTHQPQVVWLAVPPGGANHHTRRQVHALRWSQDRFADLETRTIAGVAVRVTSPARTIVDCFRCSRQISLEGAIEALRVGLRRGISPAEIASIAQRQHVVSIRPYLEALA